MPKIYTILSTMYSLGYIKHVFVSSSETIIVVGFKTMFGLHFISLNLLYIIATLVFYIISLPFYFKSIIPHDIGSFGKGFYTLDYEEVVEFKNAY